MNGEWQYKGFTCWIEHDVEEDNIKNWHYYRGADGVAKTMPLSPYVHEDAMRAWIDAGCPQPIPPHYSFYFVGGILK
jgi:hypothetical protein